MRISTDASRGKVDVPRLVRVLRRLQDLLVVRVGLAEIVPFTDVVDGDRHGEVEDNRREQRPHDDVEVADVQEGGHDERRGPHDRGRTWPPDEAFDSMAAAVSPSIP